MTCFFTSDRKLFVSDLLIVQFQKISIIPPQKGLEIPRGWGVCKTKKILKNVSSLIRISRGVGVLEKNPFRGEGMDIFWNNTLLQLSHALHFPEGFSEHLFNIFLLINN